MILARVFTGVHILQTHRNLFSGEAVEPICQLCLLEEDLVTRCPAFHDIRVVTVQRLKKRVLEHSGSYV